MRKTNNRMFNTSVGKAGISPECEAVKYAALTKAAPLGEAQSETLRRGYHLFVNSNKKFEFANLL